MDLHGNAALSWSGRRQLARRVVDQGWTLTAAAEAAGVADRVGFHCTPDGCWAQYAGSVRGRRELSLPADAGSRVGSQSAGDLCDDFCNNVCSRFERVEAVLTKP